MLVKDESMLFLLLERSSRVLGSGGGAGVGFFRFEVGPLGSVVTGIVGLERDAGALDVPFMAEALEVVRFGEFYCKRKF